jgi:hypothetical protein
MIRKPKPSQARLRIGEPPGSPKPAVRYRQSETRAKLENADFAVAWMFRLMFPGGGNKVLLTMFARQFFPTSAAIERFH